MAASPERSLTRDVLLAAVAVALVVATSILDQIATYPNLAPLYSGLIKPAFNPPIWLFAPVWTTLYALMAFGLWRILRLPSGTGGRAAVLSLFFLQLALNAADATRTLGAVVLAGGALSALSMVSGPS